MKILINMASLKKLSGEFGDDEIEQFASSSNHTNNTSVFITFDRRPSFNKKN
jgi:hypothetical protein